MVIIDRQTAIKKLKAGQRMYQHRWEHDQYFIGKNAFQVEVGRWLIEQGLVKTYSYKTYHSWRNCGVGIVSEWSWV